MGGEDVIRKVITILVPGTEPMSMTDIYRNLQKEVSRDDLKDLIRQYHGYFETFKDGQTFVRYVTKLSLCEAHCSKDKQCPGQLPYCSGLHVCKFYVLSGSCKFKQQCEFGHDLTSPHNRNVLKQHLLDHLPVQKIKDVLKNASNRDGVTKPKICKFYNVAGQSCRNTQSGRSCPHLHICRHYIQGTCRFGQRCKRSHDVIAPDVKAILEKHGISTRRTPKEILADLRDTLEDGSDSGSLNSGGGNRPAQMGDLIQEMSDSNFNSPGNQGNRDTRSTRHHIQERPGLLGPCPDFNSPGNQGNRDTRSARPRIQEGPGLLGPGPMPNNRRPNSASRSGRSQQDTPPQYARQHTGSRDQPGSRDRPPIPQGAQGGPRDLTPKTSKPKGAHAGAIPKTPSVTSLSREVSTDSSSRQLVCMFHLKGRCAYASKCFNYHCELPYQWLYMDFGGDKWIPVDNEENLNIELQYSDPVNTEYFLLMDDLTAKLNFKTMEATDGLRTVMFRRLSTETSAVLDTQPLATHWIWYWQGQMGDWKKYGDDDMGYTAMVSSPNIEQAYIANPESQMKFVTQGHQYILDFTKMVQKNLEYKTERNVARRPEFVPKEQFEIRKRQPPRHIGTSVSQNAVGGIAVVSAPLHWNLGSDSELIDHYQVVPLERRKPHMQREYKKIEDLFCESMPSTVSIKSIDRVENGDLWYNYESKKLKMKKKNNDKEVEERLLFHGTQNQYLDAICRQGFDFRLSGTSSGTAYGKGSYFATTAKYSNSYTAYEKDNRVMFVAKVLVGDYTVGKKTYCRPPAKQPDDPSSQLYDSCVDDLKQPKIFVMFENGQVYPEYLVKYDYNFSV